MAEVTPHDRKRSLAFGLDRISLLAFRRPRMVAIVAVLVSIVTAYGLTQITIDRDLRNIFRGETEVYETYALATDTYVDPENQALILIEDPALGSPENFVRLRDLHLELSITPDVGSVFSLFSLRAPPDADGNTRPLVADPEAGLDAALIEAIRAHPILGENVLSADGLVMLFIITHSEAKATLQEHDDLIVALQEIADRFEADTGMQSTVTGFAPMRAEIVRQLQRDQLVLNGSGVIIGFILSLILFRSLLGAVMTAVPAAFAGVTILGWLGTLGIETTILSTIVPALVMVLGYADGMHLTAAWRRFRQEGYDPVKAEQLALIEVGPACMLTALTTSIAFLSMTLSDVGIVRDFGWIGAIGAVSATTMVLIGHGFVTRLIGRFWQIGAKSAGSPIALLSGPCEKTTRWVTARGGVISAFAIAATVALGAAFFTVPPEHSLSETLSNGHPMVRAVHVVDAELGGAYPVQIIVPLDGNAPDSPEGLAGIRAVHEAVAEVPEVSTPLSLWSLAAWAGATDGGGLELLADLPENTQRLFVGEPGALVTVNIAERSTAETGDIIDAIEAAVEAVAPDAIVTGASVVGAREATRTIGNLNRSLGLAIVVALLLLAVALRSASAAIVAALPNILPIFAVGAILFLLDGGMQLTSIVSLTIAFGIAIDDTIHYLNAVFLTTSGDIRQRLIKASRKVGPVLLGTTFVLVGGLSMTQTSGLATIALFGLLAMASLTVAVIADIVFLPGIITGPARRLFRWVNSTDETAEDAATGPISSEH